MADDYAWRRNLGALAPKLSAAEYRYFWMVAAAARRHDLRALARLINKAPTRRLRGHALAVFAIHHASKYKSRPVALRLFRTAVGLWIDEYRFLTGVPLIRAVIEHALDDPDFEQKFFGNGAR